MEIDYDSKNNDGKLIQFQQTNLTHQIPIN